MREREKKVVTVREKGVRWRDEGGRKRRRETGQQKEREGRGGPGLSAQTAAPRSIFDYHIIETVFTEICVCLSLSFWPHHSSFRLSATSHVWYIL